MLPLGNDPGKAQRALSISQETCLFFVFEILTEDRKAQWFVVSIGLTYCLRIGILPVSFLTDRNNRVTVGFMLRRTGHNLPEWSKWNKN